MKIGSKYTREEIDDFREKEDIKSFRFSHKRIVVGEDYHYTNNFDGTYTLESTYESRLEDSKNSDKPNIHRPESKKFKSYYG